MFFLIAVMIAALSGMGIGGGGLFALYLKFYEIGIVQLFYIVVLSYADVSAHFTFVAKRRTVI